MTATSGTILALLQGACFLGLAPLVSGVLRVMRAKIHTRQGPGILQDYRDLLKLLRRQDVRPPAAGPIFRITPVVMLAATLVIAMSLPAVTAAAPLAGIGDMFAVIYLFALNRFFFSLCGLDSGSSFAGIGASRETSLGTLVEPVMVLSLLVVALLAGSTDLGAMGDVITSDHLTAPAAVAMAAVAFAFAAYLELGKLPYDFAEAEQELQEGPLMEYSGPSLALLKLAISLKQLAIIVLFAAIFLPFGKMESFSHSGLLMVAALLAAKVAVMVFFIGITENSVARLRFMKTSFHTWFGMGLGGLAFIFYLIRL